MKKLALMTVLVTAVAFPAMAGKHGCAIDSSTKHTTKKVKVSKGQKNATVFPPSHVQLAEGDKIVIEGKKVYYVRADGYRYFAPNGPYTTGNGEVFYTEDGLVLWTAMPADTVK